MTVLRTLYGKLAATLLLLFCLVGLIFLMLTRYSTELYQQEVSQELNRDLAQHIVAEKLLLQNGRVNQAALDDVFHMLMVINPSIELYLVDLEGRILAFSAPPGKVKRRDIDLRPVQTMLQGKAQLPLLGDDPREPTQRKIFSAAPVAGAQGVEGYLYVILASQEYAGVAQALQGSYALRSSAWMVASALLFAFVAGLLLFALLTRRLRRLTAAVGRWEQGGLGADPALVPSGSGRSGDEIDSLAATFNQMAERIAQQLQALKQTDALRRELVANVSHDLRTPLTSLQGYLETLLLKEHDLSAGERRKYLETAVRQSQRLGKLVGDLFELAKLECREVQPEPEPFSLSELVQDAVQKLDLVAQKHGVQLSASVSPDVPFVNADIGMIERVLVNLVDNALRFTPAGGSVSLSLAEEPDRVVVRVADTGCGIASDELPQLFNHAYRLTKVSRHHPESTGLGLAIAKRILELHGGTIHVESQLNAGATFSFSLPKFAGSPVLVPAP